MGSFVNDGFDWIIKYFNFYPSSISLGFLEENFGNCCGILSKWSRISLENLKASLCEWIKVLLLNFWGKFFSQNSLTPIQIFNGFFLNFLSGYLGKISYQPKIFLKKSVSTKSPRSVSSFHIHQSVTFHPEILSNSDINFKSSEISN